MKKRDIFWKNSYFLQPNFAQLSEFFIILVSKRSWFFYNCLNFYLRVRFLALKYCWFWEGKEIQLYINRYKNFLDIPMKFISIYLFCATLMHTQFLGLPYFAGGNKRFLAKIVIFFKSTKMCLVCAQIFLSQMKVY